MVYMGSKTKYCKYIVPIINKYIKQNNIKYFIDVFCGGANLADKIECQRVICNDLSSTLIALHQQAQKDFSKIPTEGNKEYWDVAKNEWQKIIKDESYKSPLPLYIIGAIEWYGSYGGGGFPKSYANPVNGRNYYQERYRNHFKQSQTQNYKKICFTNDDYINLDMTDWNNTILYCDAPYKNTQSYGISKNFNFEEYYEWIRIQSQKCPIFISEQELPDDLNKNILWQDEAIRTLSKDNHCVACEKLFYVDNRKNLTK